MDQNKESDITASVDAISKIPAIASILEVVCRTTGMGFSAVARVTEDRWVACAVKDDIGFGLVPGGELRVETTICHEIRQSGIPVVIDSVECDPIFQHHHTPAMYGFQSYISVPIILKTGEFFGTLCAIDPKPAKLTNPEARHLFHLLADLVAFYLQAAQQLDTANEQILEERKLAELREQFIAVIGHDLRNPLNAVLNSVQLQQRLEASDQMQRLSKIIQDASFRMKGLIENMMDFANGRLGGGIKIDREPDAPIAESLGEIVREMEQVWPGRKIELELHIDHPVYADAKRIGQLFANLLGNALSYGDPSAPVEVKAWSRSDYFTLAITNVGNPIPDAVQPQLFKPFFRGAVLPNKDGLGLGLFIASEIAKAHDGGIMVLSNEEFTRFTFQFRNSASDTQ